MEPPSRTTLFLDILFTPPVYKTYIFHQDFSSRDNLMLTVKAYAFCKVVSKIKAIGDCFKVKTILREVVSKLKPFLKGHFKFGNPRGGFNNKILLTRCF